MVRSSRPRSVAVGRRSLRYRPRLETLEQRLPPGDALLGFLVTWPEFTPEITACEFPEASSAFGGADDMMEPEHVLSRPVRVPAVAPVVDASDETDQQPTTLAEWPV